MFLRNHEDVEGGYVFSRVPFPLLAIHRANQTYSYPLNSYNLMNFLEFSSDHYANLFVDQIFKGFIFYKIQLIRHLHLRGAAFIKLLFGGIRNQNNPDQDPALYQFLRNERGQATTFALGQQPYAEASLGVGNIFKVLRLNAVRRLTYLDHPNVAAWGLRGRFFKVNF